MRNMDVATLLVVVAAVVVSAGNDGPFPRVGSHEVDIWVCLDLCVLQGGQLGPVESQSLLGIEGVAEFAAVSSSL